MNPSLYDILENTPAVTALLKGPLPSDQLRVYPWGRAPQDVKKPYAVYAVYNANPENYLDRVPDIDNKGTQISVYAVTAKSLESCYLAIRNALEPQAHMLNFTTPDQDADTNLFSCRMEFDFWDER